MDYNRVALFVRVVTTGSFTAAAAELGLPKSSVSRGVSLLEQDLGVRLLQRTTRQLMLTDAGQAYFEAVKASIGGIDEADAAAREHGSEPKGVVRLTAPPDYATLAPALMQFKRKYPSVRIEISLTSRYVDLVAEGFDLAIRAGRLEDSSMVARRVGASDIAMLASPDYLRARGVPKAVSELPSHDWVLYRASGGRATLQLRCEGETKSVEVSGTLIADDMAFCRSAAEAGAGIALLPVHTASEAISTGKLDFVLPQWRPHESAIYVVLPTARHVPTRVALLRDFLVEQLGQQLSATHRRCEQANKQRAERKR